MSSEITHTTLATLRRFVQRPSAQPELERCELCATGLAERHEHLLDPQSRQLACACNACALLFPETAPAQAALRPRLKYVRIVRRAVALSEVTLDDETWARLDLPVRLVFLAPSRIHQRVFVLYPHRGGLTEGVLQRDAWEALCIAHPTLAMLAPEVEGLLLDGRANPTRSYRVSVDVCHRLVGVLRSSADPVAALNREIHQLDGARHA